MTVNHVSQNVSPKIYKDKKMIYLFYLEIVTLKEFSLYLFVSIYYSVSSPLSRHGNNMDSLDSLLPSIPISHEFLVSPLDNIQCLHRADECKFLLVDQHWCVHV